MFSEEGGVGTISSARRGFFCERDTFAGLLVPPAFFDFTAACFDGPPAPGFFRADDRPVGRALFFAGFEAFARPPPLDLAAVFRAAVFLVTARFLWRVVLVFFGDEVDRDAPLAL